MKRAATVLALGVVLLTRMAWADCGSIPFKPWVSITRSELRSLDEDLFDLLKNHSTLKLRTWEIKGPLSAFRRDVITR